ncbi:protein-S-isoprenylcysteine methyltransferase [Aliidongia dinghuensis]|uniref:Protein-S-isoprenylcysteine methyltransferase n=1 Tax=Aliidongia dinghuensis TaxID=1867774 RepID=A0A8J2YS37_9PROT|nr:isoprenylcysteine carboxylmethyltransferase family protein [Aliidongia dinghuensis]GGF14356.1 protein-S-isoprenylcysteine methyltransferase [Aliidongia dinghuensis]
MSDRLVRGVVAAWFLLLATVVALGIGSALTGDRPMTELDYARIASKVAVISFLAMMGYLTIVRASPLAQAKGWQPRISAFVGTNLIFIGMLFLSPRTDLGIGAHIASTCLILTGNALCVYVLSHLGRSFSIMAEARKLISNGPYRVVRHPLYFAEQVAIIGVFIQYASVMAAVLIAIHFSFQLRRMFNEERLLRATFPEYAAYMSHTARLIPAIW